MVEPGHAPRPRSAGGSRRRAATGVPRTGAPLSRPVSAPATRSTRVSSRLLSNTAAAAARPSVSETTFATVDASVAWPNGFSEMVERRPTMDDHMSAHREFLSKSQSRRAAVSGIMRRVSSNRARVQGARRTAMRHAARDSANQTCRHLVHGAHAKAGGLGLNRAKTANSLHGPVSASSAGSHRRRPWSASAVNRSTSALNLQPRGVSRPHDQQLVGLHQAARDPVAAAIAARKSRSEWWRSGDEPAPSQPPSVDGRLSSQGASLLSASGGDAPEREPDSELEYSGSVTVPKDSSGLELGAHRVGWVLVTPEETKALQAALALLKRVQEISQIDMQEMERRWVARVQQLKREALLRSSRNNNQEAVRGKAVPAVSLCYGCLYLRFVCSLAHLASAMGHYHVGTRWANLWLHLRHRQAPSSKALVIRCCTSTCSWRSYSSSKAERWGVRRSQLCMCTSDLDLADYRFNSSCT